MLETFLELNGAAFSASDAEAVIGILQLAASETQEDAFIARVRSHTQLPR